MKGKSWSANLFFVQTPPFTQKYRPKHICQQTCSEILLDCRTLFGHFQIFSTRKWSGNINQHSVLSRNFTSERKRREDKGARGCMGDCRKADISTYNPLRPRSHRVGGQKQYIFTPLWNKIHFHAKSFHFFSHGRRENPPILVAKTVNSRTTLLLNWFLLKQPHTPVPSFL